MRSTPSVADLADEARMAALIAEAVDIVIDGRSPDVRVAIEPRLSRYRMNGSSGSGSDRARTSGCWFRTIGPDGLSVPSRWRTIAEIVQPRSCRTGTSTSSPYVSMQGWGSLRADCFVAVSIEEDTFPRLGGPAPGRGWGRSDLAKGSGQPRLHRSKRKKEAGTELPHLNRTPHQH